MWLRFKDIRGKWDEEHFFDWDYDEFLEVRKAMKESFEERYGEELERDGFVMGFTPNDHAREIAREKGFDWNKGTYLPMIGVMALIQDVQYAEGSYEEGPTTKWKRLKGPYPPGSVSIM
jgi:hypothetical protein